jgi:signal transduction histidine kinase
MVSVVTSPLTKLGFRRDLKLFFSILVAFLVLLMFAALVLLHRDIDRLADVHDVHWRTITGLVSDALSDQPTLAPSSVDASLTFFRGRYHIAAIEVLDQNRRRVVLSGLPLSTPAARRIEQPFSRGFVICTFDGSLLQSSEVTFTAVAALCIIASIISAVLLALYLPRVVRPIEEMLDDARALQEKAAGVDEARYLIDTFRESIATLRRQEAELRQLHDREKTRADELEIVSGTLTRNLSAGFISLDADGRLLEMNAAAREILGIAPSEASGGRPLAAIDLPHEFRDAVVAAHAARATINRRELSWGGGDPHSIGLSMTPLFAEDGRFLGSLTLFTDLREVRALETRVRDLETLAQLGEMSAGIAHEFRNSLSTISGYLRLAQKEELPQTAGNRLKEAEREASSLAGTVGALLNFAKPIHPEFEEVDLHEIARAVADRMRDGNPAVPVELSGGAARVMGDRRLLDRVVENIVRNAIEATAVKEGEKLPVEIVVSEDHGGVLRVTDHGTGVDPAFAARLFLPFQSTKTTGLGLGLALARKIVLLHGGDLSLTSAPGGGAIATMRLPRAGTAPTGTIRNNQQA